MYKLSASSSIRIYLDVDKKRTSDVMQRGDANEYRKVKPAVKTMLS